MDPSELARPHERRRHPARPVGRPVPPKRVLLVLPGAFGPNGGLEMYDRLIIKGFHDIARDAGGACETLLLLDEEGQMDERYLDRAAPKPQGFAGSRGRFTAAALARVARFRPDLVVFGHVNFGPLALAIRALRRTTSQWFLTYGIDVWRTLPAPHRLALRTAQSVLSISNYTRDELCRFNDIARGSVQLLPCAIDPFLAADCERRAVAERPDLSRPMLLTVARLSETELYKGVDQVIRAMPKILESAPNTRYVVVGQGGDRPRLERLAREVGVADRVEFWGRVTPEVLASAYAQSSVFAMPSGNEGFGIVFLEAALYGKASIGGNHGGTPDVIVDGVTGRLVQHGDVAGFASACLDLLADPLRLAAMGERARRRLQQQFTYATFLGTLRRILGA